MRGSLFRQQALDHQRPTLIGSALAAQPMSFKVITAVAVGFAVAVVLFGCFAEYTQKTRVTGYLAPTAALIHVYTPAAGTLVQQYVTEGQTVRRGDTLFVIERSPGAALLAITAPADGTVAAIKGQAGLSAAPQSPVLSLLPPNARLQAQLLVPSRAIGSVRAGDAVRVRYPAFPHQRYGNFAGVVTGISKTLIAPTEIDGPVTANEPMYRVTVALERQTVVAGGTTWPLQAGMQLEADVTLARRRLIQWVLDPLLAVGTRA